MSYTYTTNEARAFESTGSPLVNYFAMLTRTLSYETNSEHLQQCWKVNPAMTVGIVFNTRDRLNGKKEKKISNEAMLWLRNNKPLTYKKNILNYVNKYGCWKDLLFIANHLKGKMNTDELQLFAEQLKRDISSLNTATSLNNANISLCAKWAPSENDCNDKKKQLAKKLASILYERNDPKKMEKYRKEYLVPLRQKIKIIETMMCNNQWQAINYQCVPGIASKRYLNAFLKHDKERYEKYLADVRSGKQEIKITGILPHELISCYMKDSTQPIETIELQWKAIIANVKSSGVLCNMMPIIDVSGSMYSASNGSIPAQVAIALGILISFCCEGQFHKKIIAFSEVPTLITLKGDSLFECFKEITNIPQGLNTNFIACAELILNFAKTFNVPDEQMPEKYVVISDMEFDKASHTGEDIQTTYQHIKDIYIRDKYKVPKFIFWNANSDNEGIFPVQCNDDGTAIISGFSEQLLKIFMQYDDFNAETIVSEIVKPYLSDIIIDESEL